MLADGWTLTRDGERRLVQGPDGVGVAVDDSVECVLEDRPRTLFDFATQVVFERLGAVACDVDLEPRRPPTFDDGPSVSIVIPHRDGVALLEPCLASIAAQTYRSIEVIVVDGGSTDDTAAFLRSRPDVRVVHGDPARGYSGACNDGVAAASGDHLLLLNNDTVLEPDAVAQLVRVARFKPRDLGAVNALTRRLDLPAVIDSLGTVVGMHGFGAPGFAGFVDFGQFAARRDLFSASFTAVLIPRSAWERVGPMDETYGYYYEDVDWSIRARILGLRIWPASRSIVYHHGSASIARSPSAHKLHLVTRNRLRFAAQVLRARQAAGFLRRYAAEDIRTLARAVRDGRVEDARAVAGAPLAIARDARLVLERRRQLAATHLVPMETIFAASAGFAVLVDGPYPRVDTQAVRGHYLLIPAVHRRALHLKNAAGDDPVSR